jgi:hypothetical protein
MSVLCDGELGTMAFIRCALEGRFIVAFGFISIGIVELIQGRTSGI